MVNNKGMTLVELIVTFSLLLIIIIGMFNIIMEIKSQLDEKQIAKDFTEYSATMNNKIHYEFIKSSDKKPNSFAYKDSADGEWQTKGKASKTENEITLFLNSAQSISTLNGKCKSIFPCIIYGNYDDHNTEKVLAIQVPNDDDKEYGIYYDGVFEPVPNQDYLDIGKITGDSQSDTDSSEKNEIVEIKVSDSIKSDQPTISNINITFPLYIKGHTKNYGFKISTSYETVQNNS